MKKKREAFPIHEVRVSHLSEPTTLVEAHIDPKHGDIIVNGYGVKKKQAKALRDWLTRAIRIAR